MLALRIIVSLMCSAAAVSLASGLSFPISLAIIVLVFIALVAARVI